MLASLDSPFVVLDADRGRNPEDSRPEEKDTSEDYYLEGGLEQDVFPHYWGYQGFETGVGLPQQEILGGSLSCQGE